MPEDAITQDALEDGAVVLRSATEREETAAAQSKVLDWLTPMDFASQRNDALSRWHPGTCQWILESPEYQKWLSNNDQTLFCQGLRGVGLTVFTAVVAVDLGRRFAADSETTGITYMYHISSLEETLLCLLKQLVKGQSSLPLIVEELYSNHQGTGTRPSLPEITSALYSVIRTKSRVFMLFDNVDGWIVCNDRPSEVLDELFKLQVECKTNIFAVARIDSGMQYFFHGFPSLEIRSSDRDMGSYLDSKISRQMSVFKDDPLLQEEIKTKILTASDGIFFLAEINFCSLLGITTAKKMRKALDNLESGPKRHGKASTMVSSRIKERGSGLKASAKKALLWISRAKDD